MDYVLHLAKAGVTKISFVTYYLYKIKNNSGVKGEGIKADKKNMIKDPYKTKCAKKMNEVS